jgi:RNA polymerase sigma-70 factor (ECF subfamily)
MSAETASRAEALLAMLDPTTRAGLEGSEGWRALLDAKIAEAHAAWPMIELSDDAFLAHVARALGCATDPSSALGELRAADLFVACASVRGDEHAISAIESKYFSGVRASLSRRGATPASIDDVQQQLRELLFCAGPDTRPKIADYAGTGELGSWLRVCAQRIATRLARAGRRESSADDEPLSEASAMSDPELDILKRRYRDDFKEAFGNALADLSVRERNVLRLHHVDGVTMENIAKAHRVHRITVVRWIEGARTRLARSVRHRLEERLGANRAEIDSIMRLLRSQLDISIRAALQK